MKVQQKTTKSTTSTTTKNERPIPLRPVEAVPVVPAGPNEPSTTLRAKVADIIANHRGSSPTHLIGACADDLQELTSALEYEHPVAKATIRQMLEIVEILWAVRDELAARVHVAAE